MAYFPRDVIPNPDDVTGTITALDGTVAAAVEGWSSASVVLTGTWSATIVVELSADGGTTWVPGAFFVPPLGLSLIATMEGYVTTNGSYPLIGLCATTNIRIRAAAYTSGTVNVRLVFADVPSITETIFNSMQQSIIASITNNSTTNIAVGSAFTGTAELTLGVAGIRVNVKADQPIEVKIQQSMDGTNWDIEDIQTFMEDEGDGRTFQSVSSYFRVVATNLGNATTTYFRLQVTLCPVVEVLPRSLTSCGKLRLAATTESYVPDPYNRLQRIPGRSILMDADRNLNVRGRVLTDEASFRDDFSGSNPYTDMTGTFYFTNGSNIVTGVGTAFTSELSTDCYIKLSSHADSAYVLISEVVNDTYLILDDDYTGATASGTGRMSFWMYEIGTGGSITQSSSEILIASGTTNGTIVHVERLGDYLPYVVGAVIRVTQRIANQEANFGMTDESDNQALIVFSGTDNTQCKLVTSFDSSDTEETTVTLPDGAVTSTSLYYQLEITANNVTLFINNVKVATHNLHIPGPYNEMNCHAYIENTGTPASTTTLALDMFFLTNFDRVEVAGIAKGDPLIVKELRSSSPTCSNVSAAVSDTELLDPNPNRLGCSIFNDSVATLYLKLGSGASSTSFTIALGRYDYYEAPANYVGRINGYWSAATGSARVTEIE